MALLTISCAKISIPPLISSVSDPDWIRIQLNQWIWIRIWNPDPDPGGQK